MVKKEKRQFSAVRAGLLSFGWFAATVFLFPEQASVQIILFLLGVFIIFGRELQFAD